MMYNPQGLPLHQTQSTQFMVDLVYIITVDCIGVPNKEANSRGILKSRIPLYALLACEVTTKLQQISTVMVPQNTLWIVSMLLLFLLRLLANLCDH